VGQASCLPKPPLQIRGRRNFVCIDEANHLSAEVAMLRPFLALVFVGSSAAVVRGESLPSFGLEFASKAASHVVVVEDGKVVESWLGDLKPGTQLFPAGEKPMARQVEYTVSLLSEAEEKQELARLGLKFVSSVSGKRMLYFLARAKPDVWESQHLARDPAHHTVWLEGGQAFAIQQPLNPGHNGLLPLYLTEAELKAAVQEIHQVHLDIEPLLQEPDKARRAAELVALLKAGARRRNIEVHAALRDCGPAAWPVLEPVLFDEKRLPLHHGLIHVAYHVGRQQTKDAMLRIQKEEQAYRDKLKADGIEFKQDEPPFSHHHHRDLAAQWALDSLRLNK
jgi:hypothetical protein